MATKSKSKTRTFVVAYDEVGWSKEDGKFDTLAAAIEAATKVVNEIGGAQYIFELVASVEDKVTIRRIETVY